jgi:ribonucleoside-diphosphate reductase alpha chain
VFIGHIENRLAYPFEVWVNGAEQPRGLGAIAKTLSMDMRAEDRQWLQVKLVRCRRRAVMTPSIWRCRLRARRSGCRAPVSGFAKLIRYRCNRAGSVCRQQGEDTRRRRADRSQEPKAGPDGALSWTVDVANHNTGDDCVLFLKELIMPMGNVAHTDVALGEYPRVLDGLCKVISPTCGYATRRGSG